jgi:hypothetical protein
MNATFQPHPDILPVAQRALWSKLKPLVALGFVLYGGTAIALRLGHRSSVDFDFFSDSPLDEQELYRNLPLLRDATVIQAQPDTLTLLVKTPADRSRDRGA